MMKSTGSEKVTHSAAKVAHEKHTRTNTISGSYKIGIII